MKINLKRIASAAAAAAVTASAGSLCVSAGSFRISADDAFIVKNGRLSMPADAGISFAMPEFKDFIGQDVEDLFDLSPVAGYKSISGEISINGESVTLPESFDMRDEGTITSVKNQGAYGTCWTFSSAASAETSLLESVPSINLSEWHTAYYPYIGGDQIEINTDTLNDHLQYGGTVYVAANLWAQWMGPVSEEKLPYGNEEMLEDEAVVSRYENDADYHLENAYLFDYEKDGSNRDYVNSLIKQFIYDGMAVDVSFSTEGYSYATNACYSTLKPREANHSVTIAGWDDNFTASNFDGNTGAWLCRNSWDTGFGDNGYFWISYADASLCEFGVFELGAADNYTVNYQHDTFVPTQTMSADDNEDINQPSYMANVFTAEETQQLEAISTYINNPGTKYEITVYTGITDPSDPASGTASAVTSGMSELTGYLTIELDENVRIEEGEQFSVVVKMYCEDSKYVLPLETCMLLEDSGTGSYIPLSSYTTYESISEYTGENESFYSEDGAEWTDVTEKNYEYTEEEKNELLEQVIAENDDMTEDQIQAYRDLFEGRDLKVVMGNMSLKAFANPCSTVDFSHISGNVPLDESVELSVKDGSDIWYSINGGEELLYTAPIAITEETEISASADGVNYTTRKYTPAKAEFIDLGYFTSLLYTNYNDILYAERADESTYNIYLSGAESSVQLFPVSAADVYMDGELMTKNEFTSKLPLDYGVNIFEFTLSQENRLDNAVTLNIYREMVNIDLETETVTFDANVELTAEDGTVFASGDSVSDYAGQTLTASADGITEEISVPERAVVPDMELDYYNETLNFLSNAEAEFAEYAAGENPSASDFISVAPRCIDGQNITSGMVMNKAFRVIPGETVTIRIAPGNGMFGSEPVTYEIPQAGEAPEENPGYTLEEGVYYLDYSDTLEYGVITSVGTEEMLAESAEMFGYDTETYAALMMERYGVSDRSELLKLMGAEWDAIFEVSAEENPEIAVRYYSQYDGFASKVKFFTFIGYQKGDMDLNGAIDALDASKALTYYAETSVGNTPEITAEEFYAGDYDCNNKIDALDASEILTYYAKKATGQI